MPAEIYDIGSTQKDLIMNKHTPRRLSPLEQVMTTIKDCSLAISITADWLGDPEWSDAERTKAQLYDYSKQLENAYSRLRNLTGAHPCK